MASDDLGSLYLAMGHADLAVRINEKTLHLYKKIGDHEGTAIACSDLAGLALSQQQIRGRTCIHRMGLHSCREYKGRTGLKLSLYAVIYTVFKVPSVRVS